MKTYEIHTTQVINRPIEEVFAFFSKPENLAVITPEKLGFKILTPTPIEMNKGRLIDYLIHLMGIPVHWRTIITDYDPPHMFIDQQLKGPYSLWHHTHTFKKIKNGGEIKDHIIYSIPFGWIGQLLHKFWIKKDLNNIFSHRKKVISDLFTNDEYKMYVTNQVGRIAA